jgi:hypothetical protein
MQRAVIIVVLTRIAVAILSLLLCSCDRLPETYPPPEQRQPLALTPDPSAMMVDMNDPDSSQHVVKDIYYDAPGSPWRWTAGHPTVKVLVYATDNVKLSSDFAIWDEGFKQTGPIELSFVVNGRLLGKEKYASPGYKHFEKAVPADWLSPDMESTISVDVDKLYVSPLDGVKFGFILTRIGFLR